jgi:hypothetical protein
MAETPLNEVRERLRSNKLRPEDIQYIDGLLTKAVAEGLGEKIGEKRVIARLPDGMDIVK